MTQASPLYVFDMSKLLDKSDEDLMIFINKYKNANYLKKVIYFLNLFDLTYADYLFAKDILKRRTKTKESRLDLLS